MTLRTLVAAVLRLVRSRRRARADVAHAADRRVWSVHTGDTVVDDLLHVRAEQRRFLP